MLVVRRPLSVVEEESFIIHLNGPLTTNNGRSNRIQYKRDERRLTLT
jgi:hypothetical protein